MIILNVFLTVKPEQEETFISDTRSLIEKSRGEDGNILYNFYKQTDEEYKYVIVEHWKDDDAINFHNSTDHFKAFKEKSSEYFVGGLDLRRYDA